MFERSLAVRVYTVGITVSRKTIAPSRNPCDPDFFCSRLAIEHHCHYSFDCRESMWSRCVCSHLAIRHRCYSSVRLQETSVSQNFCSHFCEQASIRSPAGDNLYSFFFFPTRRYMTQRSFWAGSRAELNQCGPDFSVRVLRSGMGGNSLAFYLPSSIGPLSSIFGTRSRSSYTSELAGRNATWTTDERTLRFALETCLCVFCVFFLLVFCFLFLFSSSLGRNITHT